MHNLLSDPTRIRAGLGAALISIILALVGCQTTPPPNPHSARQRLEPLLEAWDRAQRDGGGCEERRATDTPLIDCERISLEISRLAVEFPNHPDVLFASAAVDFERGKKEVALKTLDVLRSIEPIYPDSAVLRARVAIDSGNLRFARRLLEEQRVLSPDHAGLWELLAAVDYLQQAHAEANKKLTIAERLGAPAWRVAYHRGLTAEAMNQPQQAAHAYAACLRAAPDFAPAKSRLRAIAVMGAAESP